MTLKEKIAAGKFIITSELGPPQSASAKVIRRKTVHFRDGVDGVNITDNQTAIVRMSSIAAGKICVEEGLEPIIQMTCRDRNRIAIQSDLLGAWALGIQNVLCLTGDYMSFGNHPEARPVFDMDSVQLTATVSNLNEGRFLSGDSIKTAPDFCIGAAANPFGEPFDFRIERLAKKIRAGAHFIQTQPVYDVEAFSKWMEAVRRRGLHTKIAILAGIMPVRSLKALRHMQTEVPGMRVPDAQLRRMEGVKDGEKEGAAMAVDIIKAVKEIEGVRGIHLMPLFWEKVTPQLLEASGLIDL